MRKIKTTNPLSTGAAAAVLGVSPKTILNWIDRGHVKAFRALDNSHYRIDVREVQRLRHGWTPEQGAIADQQTNDFLKDFGLV